MSGRPLNLTRLKKWPIFLGLIFSSIFLIYLVPVPPSVWSNLPNREIISEGFKLIEMEKPWLPLSVTPEDTYLTFWYLLPPIAVVLIMGLDLSQAELRRAVLSILAFGIVSVLLAFIQVLTNSEAVYIYKISNFSFPTGFFSNTNHFATFLCMLIPLAIYESVSSSRKWVSIGIYRVITGFLIVLFAVLIVLCDSMAGYMISFGVILVSLWNVRNQASAWVKYMPIFMAVIILLYLLDFFLLGGYSGYFIKEFENNGNGSRQNVFSTIWNNIETFSIFGTGPGSFYDVFLTWENRDSVGLRFMNQAHNDYLSLWIEMGIVGFLLIFVIALSALYHVVKIIIRPQRTKLASFAAISVFAVMVASIVDYPMRTIGLSTLFTFFAMLMFALDKLQSDQA